MKGEFPSLAYCLAGGMKFWWSSVWCNLPPWDDLQNHAAFCKYTKKNWRELKGKWPDLFAKGFCWHSGSGFQHPLVHECWKKMGRSESAVIMVLNLWGISRKRTTVEGSATALRSWRAWPQLNGMLLPGDVRCAESLLFTVQRESSPWSKSGISFSPIFFFFLSESVWLSSVCEIIGSKNVKDNSGGKKKAQQQATAGNLVERVKKKHVGIWGGVLHGCNQCLFELLCLCVISNRSAHSDLWLHDISVHTTATLNYRTLDVYSFRKRLWDGWIAAVCETLRSGTNNYSSVTGIPFLPQSCLNSSKSSSLQLHVHLCSNKPLNTLPNKVTFEICFSE